MILHKGLSKKGISLIEVIVALGITTIVITALLSMTIYSMRASQQTRLMLEATKDSNSMMETIRAFRDTGDVSWSDFITCTTTSATGCSQCQGNNTCTIAVKNDNTGYNVSAISVPADASISATADPYVYFSVTDPISNATPTTSSTVVRITVTAKWRVGSSVKQTQIYTDLTNWRGK